MDYRLRPYPSELAELPTEGISPEIGQVVQEALQKQHAIMNEAVRERAIELGAMDGDVPSIFVQSTVSSAGRNGQKGRNTTKQRYIFRPNMSGASAGDESDSSSESDSFFSTTGSVEPLPRMRPLSDLSQSSGSSTNYGTASSSAGSRSSVDTQEVEPTSPVKKLEEEQNKRSRPTDWIKSRIGRTNQPHSKDMDECLACATAFPVKQLVFLACPEKHKYCRSCFEQLVKSGCENEGVFPPQCCQVAVSPSLVMAKVSRNTRKMYAALDKAVKIAPDERWYCPNPKCAKAIDVSKAEISQRGAKCPHCRHYICVSCRQASHLKNAECGDGALKATLLMSKDRGWQTCYKCGEMVELTMGCRHIKCRCKAEFCYVCNRKWGSCADNYVCAKKLEDMRSAQNTTEESIIEYQALVADEPVRPSRVDGSRATDETVLTEEEQVARAIRETLREMEEAELTRALGEFMRTVAVIAEVEVFKARDMQSLESREEERLATIAQRFRSYDAEIQQIKVYQQGLIENRHRARQIPLPNLLERDMQWLQRMHAERLNILAEDRELLVQDRDFALNDYRRAARQSGIVAAGLVGHNPVPKLSPIGIPITRQNATKVRPSLQSRSTARMGKSAMNQGAGPIMSRARPQPPAIDQPLERITLIDP